MHLGTVVGIMKLHTDYDAFEKQLDLVAPIYPETPWAIRQPERLGRTRIITCRDLNENAAILLWLRLLLSDGE